MKLRFRHLSILTALAFLVLAVMWMFAPAVVLKGWGVGLSSSAGLVGRRAAALYAGIGVMFLVARNSPPSLARSSLVAGIVTACLLLAVLGVFELLTGHANSGILPAALAEVALALAFLFVAHSERVSTPSTNSPVRQST